MPITWPPPARNILHADQSDLSDRCRRRARRRTKFFPAIACEEIERLVQCKVVSGGMILKLEAAKRALEGGVREVHIVGGTIPGRAARWRVARRNPAHGILRRIPGTRVLREPIAVARSRGSFGGVMRKLNQNPDECARFAQNARSRQTRNPRSMRSAFARRRTVSSADLQAAAHCFHARPRRYVFDSTGKKYLDFLGGIAVNALGHAHPRIVKTIRREAARAIHFSNLFHNAFQGPLARKLAEWSGLDRVFFSNSGTEAIDGALKLARLCGTPGEARALRIRRKNTHPGA